MDCTRRSARLASTERRVVYTEAADDDGARSPDSTASDDFGRRRVRRPRRAHVSDARLHALERAGDGGAARVMRNRQSARRSREGFDERVRTMLGELRAIDLRSADLRARLRAAAVAEAEVAEAATLATATAKAGFVPHEPPKRSPGSRTDVTDEMLLARIEEGDVKALRTWNNRESARKSRRRKWDEFNSAALRLTEGVATFRALAELLRARTGEVHVCADADTRLEAEGEGEEEEMAEDDDEEDAASLPARPRLVPASPPTSTLPSPAPASPASTVISSSSSSSSTTPCSPASPPRKAPATPAVIARTAPSLSFTAGVRPQAASPTRVAHSIDPAVISGGQPPEAG